jgi:hypothetical protein
MHIISIPLAHTYMFRLGVQLADEPRPKKKSHCFLLGNLRSKKLLPWKSRTTRESSRMTCESTRFGGVKSMKKKLVGEGGITVTFYLFWPKAPQKMLPLHKKKIEEGTFYPKSWKMHDFNKKNRVDDTRWYVDDLSASYNAWICDKIMKKNLAGWKIVFFGLRAPEISH